MKLLLTADTHFSERSRDDFKWGFFDWLVEQKKKYQVDEIIIAGDLMEFKDRHSAYLVNKVVDGFIRISPATVLKGNHDYIDPANPFFKFLGEIEGIRFINEPTWDTRMLYVPHCRTQKEFNTAILLHMGARGVPSGYTVICHQTFESAISETGLKMPGLKYNLSNIAYSGDIHKPQVVDNRIVYIGSPWHNRFGDDYYPRVLLIENGEVIENLYYPAPRKHILKINNASDIANSICRPLDHVRVVLLLLPEEVVNEAKHREQVVNACREYQLELFGVEIEVVGRIKQDRQMIKSSFTKEEVFNEFCIAEGVPPQIKQAGQRLLDDQ